MIEDSLLGYIGIRLSITLLRLVTPASFVYLIICLPNSRFFWAPLVVWATSEVFFYLLVYLPRSLTLQKPPIHPIPNLSQSERKSIFDRCIAAAAHDSSDSAPYPTDWFLPKNSTPNREDVKDWLLWALFSSHEDGSLEEWDEELSRYISEVEKILGKKLKEGRSNVKQLRSMRITMDPVVMLHRPLVWYFIVGIVDLYTSLRLKYLGFNHYTPRETRWSSTFPPRPILSLLSRAAPIGVVTPYWYRPHKSTTKLPIMFLHGIGIGLYPYIPFLNSIVDSGDSDVGILLPELLPISMHMTHQTVPPRPVMLKSLNLILEDSQRREDEQVGDYQLENLDAHLHPKKTKGWDEVVLIAHSYGTFVAGWVVRDFIKSQTPTSATSDNSKLEDKIAHMVLVDPIPILLSNPAVAHNFLYREPSTVFAHRTSPASPESASSWYSSAAAWQLWYFASRDADIARTLHRAFFWAEGGVWKDDIEAFMRKPGGRNRDVRNQDGNIMDGRKGRNFAVVLGGIDQIVPAEAIKRYLTPEDGWSKTSVTNGNMLKEYTPSDDGKLELLFNPKLDHAVIFDEKKLTEPLLKLIRRYVRDV